MTGQEPDAREVEETLGKLRWVWAPVYKFGRDPRVGWWAVRAEARGGLLADEDPDGLLRLVAAENSALAAPSPDEPRPGRPGATPSARGGQNGARP